MLWAAPTTVTDFPAISHPWLGGCFTSELDFCRHLGSLYSIETGDHGQRKKRKKSTIQEVEGPTYETAFFCQSGDPQCVRDNDGILLAWSIGCYGGYSYR